MSMEKTSNQLLGYPDDARLLIVNADDFGMCHSNVAATLHAIARGIVTSTTLMAPCPWAGYAIDALKAHPEIAFGVHLTYVSEHPLYRWGPLAPKADVPSLLDEAGFFYANRRRDELLARAKIDEIELEFRTQIRRVLDAGLTPTHLDWHCLYDGGRSDVLELTRRLAREHGLAMRLHGSENAATFTSAGLPVVDRGVLDSYSLGLDGKAETCARLLRELPAGLSEWAFHPGLGDAEARAMEPEGWEVRLTDHQFVTSPAAREIVEAEGIVLLDYRALQRIWAAV